MPGGFKDLSELHTASVEGGRPEMFHKVLEAAMWRAERELSVLRDHRERVEQLEADRDALIEAMAETVPDALDGLIGEERNKVYRMLRLEVTPTPEGYSVTGALRARLQNGIGTLLAVPTQSYRVLPNPSCPLSR